MKRESSVGAEMKTQVHNWMIKSTMNHFQLFAWTKYKGDVLDHVTVQRSSREVMKTSIRFPEWKSRLFKDSLAVQILRAQGWCNAGCSVTCTEAPGAGAGRGPGWGRRQTVCSPYSTRPCPVLCLALVQCRDVLTLFQTLGYSSKVETKYR